MKSHGTYVSKWDEYLAEMSYILFLYAERLLLLYDNIINMFNNF